MTSSPRARRRHRAGAAGPGLPPAGGAAQDRRAGGRPRSPARDWRPSEGTPNVGGVRTRSRRQAHLVTEARQPRSAEIGQRQRRYLLMMGIRLACFIVAVVMFLHHAGWLAAIPALGATVLPYFAVVVANARRPGSRGRGFRPYEPALPERAAPPSPAGAPGRPADDRGQTWAG